VPVQRSRDAEGVAVAYRLAEQVDEGGVDAGVPDAGGREKKFQGVLLRSQVEVVRRRYDWGARWKSSIVPPLVG
jgi:hypothetical protein